MQVYDVEKRTWTTKIEENDVAKKEFIETFKKLGGENSISPKLFFGVETFGSMDLALIPFYCRFDVSETFRKFNIVAECPKIIAWGKRCMQKECVAEGLPDQKKIYEFIVQLRKKLGLD